MSFSRNVRKSCSSGFSYYALKSELLSYCIFCWVSPNYERQEMNMGYLCWGMGEAALPTIVILKYLYQTLNSSATSCNCIHSSTIGCSAFIIYRKIRNILKCLNVAENMEPRPNISDKMLNLLGQSECNPAAQNSENSGLLGPPLSNIL